MSTGDFYNAVFIRKYVLFSFKEQFVLEKNIFRQYSTLSKKQQGDCAMRIQLYPENSNESNLSVSPYLDTFLLEGAGTPLGAVLVLPGGGYRLRAAHEGDPVAEVFNRMGFHAFTLQYRVLPDQAPCAQKDAVRAMKIIRANAEKWRLDPNKIAILGFSAGGHLAACTGLMHDQIDAGCGDEYDAVSARPDAMILCYSVLSVLKTYTERGIEFGKGSCYCDAEGKEIEPYTMINSNTPPAFIWHTADDVTVPVWCSMRFAERMWEEGISCELHVFPHAPHGRGLGISHQDIEDWPREAGLFLKQHCGF